LLREKKEKKEIGNCKKTSSSSYLFEDKERKTDLYKAIDDVKNRFGKLKIKRASSN
jgi:hypothetical protein